MKKVSGQIKTLKTSHYMMLHNDVVQNQLQDIASLGILTYIMSLPAEFRIYKTTLAKRWGKANTNRAFDELIEKGYIVSIKFRDGQRNLYQYLASDLPIEKSQIIETIKEIDLPIMELKSCYEDLNKSSISEVSKLEPSENAVKSTISQSPILNTSESFIQDESFTTGDYKVNNNKINNNKINNNKINKEIIIETLQRDNVVIHSNNIDKNDQRLEKIKNDNLDISTDWIDQIFLEAINKGKDNPYGYVVSAIKKFRENTSNSEKRQVKQQVESKLPSWLKNNDHKKVTADELKNLEKEYYEKKKKEINAKLGV